MIQSISDSSGATICNKTCTLLALNLPDGEEGSEFGGIDFTIEDRPLAIGASVFAQLAWYF